MIKILAKVYSMAVEQICEKLDNELAQYDLLLSKNNASSSQFLKESIGCSALLIIGDVGDNGTLFADTFGLSMFYDKFAERNVKEYCKLSNIALPPQHIMDKLCIAPETFNHFASSYGYRCACYGEFKKTHIYLIPDDVRECVSIFDNYINKVLFKTPTTATRLIFKVFGLSFAAVSEKLDALGKFVSHKCETKNLDSKIIITFPPKCAKSIIAETTEKMEELFGNFIYATSDQSLASTVVQLLNRLGKTISTAESITGGMIASSIVSVPGASSVFFESAVTYSVQAKNNRLGVSPHFVDEYGVVSQQVAQKMALGLKENGTDIAVSTTGFAGPTSADGMPVGLCYIGIATEKGVSVYRNVFTGDRNSIRTQAANMALYLVCKTLTK